MQLTHALPEDLRGSLPTIKEIEAELSTETERSRRSRGKKA